MSSYPADFDSLAKPGPDTREDDAGFEHDVLHTEVAEAIEAVQATLGLDPAGDSDTVAERLDGLVASTDSRLSDARTPTAHKASHATGGSDALSASDIGAEPSGTASSAVSTHSGATDPHGDRSWATSQFIPLSQRDAANGVAVLDSGQKIALARVPQGANGVLVLDGSGLVPTSALPPLAINETSVVASQSAMLALTAQRGDMAIRTDNGRTYVLSTDSASTLADWKEVLAAGQVTSVNGQTGVVSIGISDISGLSSALSGKVDVSTLTTKGDLIVRDSTSPVRIGVGSNGQVLTADSAATPGVKWATPATAASVTTGSAAPSGGADGDWYLRSGTPTIMYQRQSGSWVAMGRASMLFERNTALRSSPWTPRGLGADAAPTEATKSSFFNQATTGVSESSGTWTASSGAAWGRYHGASGGFLNVEIKTMPGSGQTLSFGMGAAFNASNCWPLITVNSSGVATLVVSGATVKTFATTIAVGKFFNIRAMAGAVLIAVVNSSGGIDETLLWASEYVATSNMDTYGVGFYLRGNGAVSFVNGAELYA